VHTGTGAGGHYFVFLRPTFGNTWFLFNDEDVTIATEKEATENNFGGVSTVTSACNTLLQSRILLTHNNRHVSVHKDNTHERTSSRSW
jgi:hypothetical protein